MATLDEVRAIVADEIKRQAPAIADAVWTREVLTGEKPATTGGKAPTKRAGVMLRQLWRSRKGGSAS